MCPKKGRKNVRKMEVSTDTPTDFELGDTAVDIQRCMEEKEPRGGEATQKQQRGRG